LRRTGAPIPVAVIGGILPLSFLSTLFGSQRYRW